MFLRDGLTAESTRRTPLKLKRPDQIANAERQVTEWEPNPAECETIGGAGRSMGLELGNVR